VFLWYYSLGSTLYRGVRVALLYTYIVLAALSFIYASKILTRPRIRVFLVHSTVLLTSRGLLKMALRCTSDSRYCPGQDLQQDLWSLSSQNLADEDVTRIRHEQGIVMSLD
jgi:hypothetical protein